MQYKTLLVAEADGVLTVTLNRPDVHNAFNDELIGEAIDLFTSIATSSLDARIVVLRGSGPTFCAGADVNWMSSMISYTRDENVRDSSKLAKLKTSGPEAVRECKKLIAYVGWHGLIDAIPYTIEAISTRRVSEEGQQGMKAFLEKKKAPWSID